MEKTNKGKSTERSINISKGIIYGFFTIYLIIYGIAISFFISSYNENNPGQLALYVNYLPLVCYVGAAFLAISFLIFIRNVRMPKARETKSRKNVKAGSIYKHALFLLIFIFSFVPLLSPIIDQGKNDQNFSAYNEDWNGCSDFKQLLEDEEYNCYNIQSSLSTTERVEENILLVILGANQYYNPLNEIPYFIDFFGENNSILICHDGGSTSTLLWQIFLANMIDDDVQDIVPITIFPNGTLRDVESYDTNPSFPVIKNFQEHDTTEDVHEVILSKSSCALGGPFIEFSGWDLIGSSSTLSYVDRNGDKEFDEEDDSFDISFITDAVDDFPDEYDKIPLGGIPGGQAVFMAKDTGNTRVFVSADASLFNNELINEDGYDNQQFALNIIKWLTRDDDKDDWMIVFDEAHIRPEDSRDMTSAGIYGFFIQYIVHLSTNPITAWIYPLLAVYTLRKYLPKKKEKEEKKKIAEQEKKEEKLRFRTSSFFSEKIEWYRVKRKYDKALTLLYRRLERKLNSLLAGSKITTKNVINMVNAKELSITKLKIRRIRRFMDRIIAIKAGKSKVKSQREFEDLFFEMEWMVNNI